MSNGKTILLVERTPLSRDVTALYLSYLGRVRVAREAHQAMAMARDNPPHLVVAGTGARADDELGFCCALKGDPDLRGIPILLLYHPEQPQDRERALRSGVAEALCKPVVRRELLSTASRLLTMPTLRPAPRVRLETAVDLRGGGSRWTGTIRNLSRHGAYVESGRTVAPGTELQIRFGLPEWSDAFASKSQVRWVRWELEAPAGMGLRFLSFNRSSARALECYLDHWIGAPPPPRLSPRDLERGLPWDG